MPKYVKEITPIMTYYDRHKLYNSNRKVISLNLFKLKPPAEFAAPPKFSPKGETAMRISSIYALPAHGKVREFYYLYFVGRKAMELNVKPTIYIDVLFLVNLIINYVLLYTTAKTGRLKINRLRLFLGAMFGAVYAVLMFFPRLNFVYTMGAKVLMSLAVVAIAFNIHGVRLFFKAVGIFYLVTLCFGGGAFAIFYFTNAGALVGALVSNGILYLNLPWQILFLSVGVSYTIFRIVMRTMQKKMSRENMYVGIRISFGGKEVDLCALVDTGNALYDPLSNAPVIVAEYEKMKPILPSEITDVFGSGGEDDIDAILGIGHGSALASRLRLIPFCSLGRENGMLIGFKPDGAFLNENECLKPVPDVIVGLYNKSLAKDKSYVALLHPEIVSR